MTQVPTTPIDPSPSGSDTADTVVIGGGIGGLLAAITAAQGHAGARVVLLDPHPPGGRARCDQRDGFTFNRGPRALYRNGPAERALAAVGIATKSGGPPSVRNGIALRGGRAHRFPGGPLDSMRTSLFTPRQKVEISRTLAAMWRPRAAATEGRSVSEWLDARSPSLPVREFVEALVRVATYAHAPETFAAAPALANARAGVHPGVRYLDGGWQSLVDQLLRVAGTEGVAIRPARVRAVASGGAGVIVTLDDGSALSAATAIIAAGGPDAAAALLPDRPRSWGALAPPVTAACLELGVRGVPAHRFALGIDEPVYGSTHAPPADLAPEGHAVVHLMRYQPVDDDQPAAAQQTRLREVATMMGITPDRIVTERFLARMVVSGTLPHPATRGLDGRPPVVIKEQPGVLLTGDWIGPTGLLLDAVASSAVEAGRLAATRSSTMVPA